MTHEFDLILSGSARDLALAGLNDNGLDGFRRKCKQALTSDKS